MSALAVTIGVIGAGFVGVSAASAPVPRCLTKPDATNTGATGARTTSKVKALVSTRSKLKNAKLAGPLVVSGDGSVVRNVSVNGPIIVTGNHVTIDHVTANSVIVSGASYLKVSRSNLSDGGTAVFVTPDRTGAQRSREVKLIGNYIHDPAATARASYSGTHLRGARGVTISCSNYALGAFGNAALLLEDANGVTSNVVVTNNWLDGGGYTILSAAKGLTLTRNTFGTSAKYGLCRDTSDRSITQRRNRLSEGSAVRPCGSAQQPDSSAPAATPSHTPSVATTPTDKAPTTKAPTPTVKPSTTGSETMKPTASASSTNPLPTASTAPAADSSCAFKPSAGTTGASGTRANSSVRVLNDGQTLENANVGGIEIRGRNVTVRNVSVAGNVFVVGDNAMIDHVTAQGVAISSASNTTVQYSNIGYSKEDGIHVTSDRGRLIRNAVLRYNYIHDPRVPSDAHYDGIQVRGVDGLVIDCSVYDPGPFQWTFNAAVYLEHANGGNSNVRVTNNWLYGHAFPVMVDAVTATFTKNRIGGDIKWDTCYAGKGLTSSNFKSSGNVWDATNKSLNLCGMG